MGYRNSRKINLTRVNSEVTSSTNFGSLFTVLSIGSSNKTHNRPVHIKLYPLATICDCTGYWSGINEIANVLEFIQDRCVHFKKALNLYASELGITMTEGKLY